MQTKAVKEFIQRSQIYKEDEDGRHFSAWYHNDDVGRIVWKLYDGLDKNTKKICRAPHVFLDGFNAPVDSIFKPLIDWLTRSSQALFAPFIIKPELANAHYMAGFLRKNPDKSISLFFFNPTGTFPRIEFGAFSYGLTVIEDNSAYSPLIPSKDILYVFIRKGLLHYQVLNNDEECIFGTIDLNQLGIKLAADTVLTQAQQRTILKPKLNQILKITLARGHTYPKMEFCYSPHQIQTMERDENKLVSCGPLSVAFIEYVLKHPEYMKQLDYTFALPDFLKQLMLTTNADYKRQIINMRQNQAKILTQIDDSLVETIDNSYAKLNEAVFNSIYNGIKGTPEALEIEQESTERVDIECIQKEIDRFKINAQACFSINNIKKADAIEAALKAAIADKVADVRKDQRVKDALAIHRIFGFFGLKATNASLHVEESLKDDPMQAPLSKT